MSNLIRVKFFVMMGLQFFIWGCWLPLIYSYLPSLGFTPAQQSWILNAFPIAAVIGLFFGNQYADRHFAAERFFGFSHLVGGAAMLLLAAWSLVLPHTPPRKVESGADRFAWLEAFKLLKQPFVLVLWLVAALDSFVLYSYFNWTGTFLSTNAAAGGVGIPGNWIMPIMSLGQISEMLTMFILGPVLKRLGIATLAAIAMALFFHPPKKGQVAPALRTVDGAETQQS